MVVLILSEECVTPQNGNPVWTSFPVSCRVQYGTAPQVSVCVLPYLLQQHFVTCVTTTRPSFSWPKRTSSPAICTSSLAAAGPSGNVQQDDEFVCSLVFLSVPHPSVLSSHVFARIFRALHGSGNTGGSGWFGSPIRDPRPDALDFVHPLTRPDPTRPDPTREMLKTS